MRWTSLGARVRRGLGARLDHAALELVTQRGPELLELLLDLVELLVRLVRDHLDDEAATGTVGQPVEDPRDLRTARGDAAEALRPIGVVPHVEVLPVVRVEVLGEALGRLAELRVAGLREGEADLVGPDLRTRLGLLEVADRDGLQPLDLVGGLGVELLELLVAQLLVLVARELEGVEQLVEGLGGLLDVAARVARRTDLTHDRREGVALQKRVRDDAVQHGVREAALLADLGRAGVDVALTDVAGLAAHAGELGGPDLVELAHDVDRDAELHEGELLLAALLHVALLVLALQDLGLGLEVLELETELLDDLVRQRRLLEEDVDGEDRRELGVLQDPRQHLGAGVVLGSVHRTIAVLLVHD